MRKGVESYLHRFAKQTVASWLRGRVRTGTNFKGLQPLADYIPIGMQAPMYGIYEEYPVLADNTGCDKNQDCADCSLHVTGWHCYCAKHTDFTVCHKHGIPVLKELNKLKIAHVFDIGVVNAAGKLCCVVEICNTNPIETRKIEWLTEHQVPWFELSADWIMKQVKSPYSISDGITRNSLSN